MASLSSQKDTDLEVENQELDQHLRAVLAPSEEAVDRVVRRALEPREAESRGRSSLIFERAWARPAIWAVASWLLVVCGYLVWQRLPIRAVDQATPNLQAELQIEALPESSSEPVFHLSNESGFVTVSTHRGARWIVLPATRTDKPEDSPVKHKGT